MTQTLDRQVTIFCYYTILAIITHVNLLTCLMTGIRPVQGVCVGVVLHSWAWWQLQTLLYSLCGLSTYFVSFALLFHFWTFFIIIVMLYMICI